MIRCDGNGSPLVGLRKQARALASEVKRQEER
jgi:hypothetical protein